MVEAVSSVYALGCQRHRGPPSENQPAEDRRPNEREGHLPGNVRSGSRRSPGQLPTVADLFSFLFAARIGLSRRTRAKALRIRPNPSVDHCERGACRPILDIEFGRNAASYPRWQGIQRLQAVPKRTSRSRTLLDLSTPGETALAHRNAHGRQPWRPGCRRKRRGAMRVCAWAIEPSGKERVTAADAQMFLDLVWQDLCYGLRMQR
jgi:hypothetical protein